MDEEPPKKEPIPGFSTIEDYTKNGFKVLVEATKSSNNLPLERDWNFYKVHDSFKKIMNVEGDKILCLMNSILHSQNINSNIRNRDLEEKIDMVIEANDDILEKVAIGIDEMNGIKRSSQEAVEMQAVSAQLPVNGSWNQLNKATFSVSSSIDTVVNDKSASLKSIRLLTAKNIVRPQSFFKDKIDNSNNPWIPRIKDKPNSIKPLAIFLEESEDREVYSHPYECELERFSPPVEQLQKANPVTPKSLEETPLKEVATPEQLEELLEELRKYSAFAVDLEHHSYRTFMGITCLMQISTENADYLIDTFTLRDKLCILNEVFTKPSIVKVFHGADCDVEWLQRDLSLYVVNMFDTHQAAKQLNYSGLSLAYLLNRFCNVTPNKHFQLADWRIRPLPDELKTYARMDTHYLLYIYQMLKNELLKKGNGSDNILRSVIQQSTQICQKSYLKPILNDYSHLDFYRKCKRLFDNRQMFALKELYQWRDTIARTEDESTGYVLPNHMLLQIAETLPREMQGVLACCNPIPPLVRANLLELHRIVLKAREQSAVKPILKEDNRSRGSTLQFTKINLDSPLHCPHDLSKSAEFRDDLPTLLGNILKNGKTEDEDNRKKADTNFELEKTQSIYSVFNTLVDSSDKTTNESNIKDKIVTVLGPYERYKLVKPYIQAEEDKAAAEKPDKSKEKLEDQTNEDRIAALHAHFVKVSKEVKQKVPAAVETTENKLVKNSMTDGASSSATLVSMGGSKKRKFNYLEFEDGSEFEPVPKIPHSELHTPVPRQTPSRRPQGRRKYKNSNQSPGIDGQRFQNYNQHTPPTEELGDLHPYPKNPHSQPQTAVRGRKRNRRQQSNRTYNSNQSPGIREQSSDNYNQYEQQAEEMGDFPPMPYSEPHTPVAGRKPNRKQQYNRRFNNSNQPQASGEQSAQNYSQQQPRNRGGSQVRDGAVSNRQKKQQEWRKRNMRGKQINQPSSQSERQNFTPFDYSSVNFQQFQGGAGSANKKQAVKSHFKGKNKNKKFNKNSNNKSITYDRRDH